MKNKGLSLFDIAQMEEEYVKDSVTDAFETLFSIIDELDGTLPLYESVEFDDSAFIPLYSSYSFIETALIHLDDLMDDILDSANRIYPLSKVDGIDKKPVGVYDCAKRGLKGEAMRAGGGVDEDEGGEPGLPPFDYLVNIEIAQVVFVIALGYV